MDGPKVKADAKADAEFVSDTVRRSMPSLTRPRLRTESEEKLAEMERKNAECYAGMESFTHQLRQIAIDIDEEPGSAVPEAFNEEENSLVIAVEELHAAAIKR